MDNYDYKIIGDSICKKLEAHPHYNVIYNDLLAFIKELMPINPKMAKQYNLKLRGYCADNLECDPRSFYKVYKECLLIDAKDDLDAYLLYLEMNREPKSRFYMPRRKVLKQVVDALQKLADGELKELFLSLPPRTGKTTLMIMFVTWLVGRNSEKPNLYSSFSDTITKTFYNGVVEVLTDPNTYSWGEVFPGQKIVSTNAADETLNIDRRKHYPSLTCRSIDGTLNGACDASDGFIIADDLVSGIEEAMNKERLINKWSKVSNNLIPRGKPTTRYLWIGTRWSILDPAGIRLDMIENDPSFKDYKYQVINLPALDENDESNFDYPYGVGYDTATFHQYRAGFERRNDMASWLAQFMGEPIEREGTLFSPGDLRYYNGELPDTAPDRIFMAVDPAYGGGDFVAAPVCMQFGEDIYVSTVVYDNGDKKTTIPLIAKVAKQYNVSLIQVEVNTATQSYKEELEKEIKDSGHRVTMTTKNSSSQQNKQQRIFDKAPDIREHMIFLESGRRSKEYVKFMENVFSFKMFLSKSGLKKQHDDAPDSLAQAIDMVVHATKTYSIFKRLF